MTIIGVVKPSQADAERIIEAAGIRLQSVLEKGFYVYPDGTFACRQCYLDDSDELLWAADKNVAYREITQPLPESLRNEIMCFYFGEQHEPSWLIASQLAAAITAITTDIHNKARFTSQHLVDFGCIGWDAASLIGQKIGKSSADVRNQIIAGGLDADTALNALSAAIGAEYGWR